MGFFDSKTSQTQKEQNDARQNQAGGDVNQNPNVVEFGDNSGKNQVHFNVTQTDHGAVNAALSANAQIAGETSESFARATGEIIDFASESSRRNTDLTGDIAKQSTAQLESITGVLDDSNRRVTDLAGDIFKAGIGQINTVTGVLDDANRRTNDLTKDLAVINASGFNSLDPDTIGPKLRGRQSYGTYY